MQKTQKLLATIGDLVVATRSTSMDQKELGQRVGVGRNTISSIENGKAVNAETLFRVLEHLSLLDDLNFVVEQKLDEQTNPLKRKTRKPTEELDNDF